jgi:hypothetical protein
MLPLLFVAKLALYATVAVSLIQKARGPEVGTLSRALNLLGAVLMSAWVAFMLWLVVS